MVPRTCGECIEPIVSVRIITYQQVKYIREAIESVLSQKTTFPFEVCIGEDGSTDGTAEICREYEKNYPGLIRVAYRDRSDSCRSAYCADHFYNWVETLRACRGKYIALLDGDDYWTDPLKLQKQVDFLDCNMQCSGCFHDTAIEWLVPPSGWEFGLAGKKDMLSISDIISADHIPFHTSSFMFRRECIDNERWRTNGRVFGDRWIFSLVSLRGRIGRIPEQMSTYRRSEGGVTVSSPSEYSLYSSWLRYLSLYREFMHGHGREANVASRSVRSFYWGLVVHSLTKSGPTSKRFSLLFSMLRRGRVFSSLEWFALVPVLCAICLWPRPGWRVAAFLRGRYESLRLQG